MLLFCELEYPVEPPISEIFCRSFEEDPGLFLLLATDKIGSRVIESLIYVCLQKGQEATVSDALFRFLCPMMESDSGNFVIQTFLRFCNTSKALSRFLKKSQKSEEIMKLISKSARFGVVSSAIDASFRLGKCYSDILDVCEKLSSGNELLPFFLFSGGPDKINSKGCMSLSKIFLFPPKHQRNLSKW